MSGTAPPPAPSTAPSTAPAKPPLWRRALPLVGVILVVAFIAQLDVGAMLDTLRDARPALVLAAAGAMAVNVVGKAIRWQRLLVGKGERVALGDATWLFFEAALLGSLTFGRFGELIRVARLADRGVAASVGLASCLVDRGLDLAVLLWVGGAAFVALTVSSAAGLVVTALGAAAFVVGSLVASRIARAEAPTGGGVRARVHRLVSDAAGFLTPRVLGEALVWTALSWLPAFSVVWILARAFSIQASWLSLTTAQAIGSLSGLLPITYQGVGTREPIFAAVLAREGVAEERAVVLALATFAVMFVSVVALGLLEIATRPLRARHAR